MKELQLKYGCNPNQSSARVYMKDGSDLPFTVLNGRPGYINLLDAFNSYQLVKELKEATGLPAAASFKHVSPAGAAVATDMSDTLKKIYWVDDLKLSPLASAYACARGADRMSSYGDFVALSDVCDVETATLLKREVSDGVIAPGYSDDALAILKTKKKGNYCVLQINPDYKPRRVESKEVYGVTFEQERNEAKITTDLFQDIPTKNKDIPAKAQRDLMIALITLKYTQSNSVCYVKDGMTIGVGAGQQSRVHCTRLAGNKADIWWLRQNPKVLNLPFRDDVRRPEPLTREEKKAWIAQLHGVALGSDAFFPFGDNIERAHRSGVDYIAQAGGSIRDDNVIETCDKYNIAMAMTGLRLFHH